MSILVTGAAGFIGYHVSRALLERGETVVGIDSINTYYSPKLKQDRLEQLRPFEKFSFNQLDISESGSVDALVKSIDGLDGIIHLAAQAGVRHSIDAPFDYASANLVGHLAMLEAARGMGDGLRHFVYASSSSVYGRNAPLPFALDDRADTPISLYAATKRSNELMTSAYADLFGLPATGLRFFTVYGPWGRPDMAAFKFATAIAEMRPITLYNHGDMRRDFTFIDDIVAGVIAALDNPPPAAGQPPHRLFNLGNNRSENLAHFVSVLEDALGRKADIEYGPMQPGDVQETFADIEESRRELGFEPRTSIEQGLPLFAEWFKRYHGLN